jgi:hypothetical protein
MTKMTFPKEMDRFWEAYDPAQRKWMETFHAQYQEAVRAENAVKAAEIVSVLFAGSLRAQYARLKKLGINSCGINRAKKHAIPWGPPSTSP